MEPLVNPKERIYFGISLAFSLIFYLILIASIVGIIYIAIGALIGVILHGLFIGKIRGNGVKVSDKQFPEVYRIASQLSTEMGLNPIPEIYVVESGGLLNAFATKFLSRNFVVIYSDVVDLAYAKGESELSFIICHELAHIKRGHLTWRWLLYPSKLIPFLSSAYSRACEYTCDRFGAYYRRDGAVGGLLILAAGKKLYHYVNPEELSNQAANERGFWIWLSEILETHPNLPKRVNAVMRFVGNSNIYFREIKH